MSCRRALWIDVGVEVDVAGEYRPIGTLLDWGRDPIEQVSPTNNGARSKTMSLCFDGAGCSTSGSTAHTSFKTW